MPGSDFEGLPHLERCACHHIPMPQKLLFYGSSAATDRPITLLRNLVVILLCNLVVGIGCQQTEKQFVPIPSTHALYRSHAFLVECKPSSSSGSEREITMLVELFARERLWLKQLHTFMTPDSENCDACEAFIRRQTAAGLRLPCLEVC